MDDDCFAELTNLIHVKTLSLLREANDWISHSGICCTFVEGMDLYIKAHAATVEQIKLEYLDMGKS